MERIVLRRNMAAQGRRGGDPFPQNQWQADLAEFVKAYPNHRLAARAKLDLAEGAEHAGRLDEARQWYRQVDEGFAESASARIARGALFRLDGLGRRVDLRTTDSAGNPLDLEDLRGRVVVIHFWTYDTPSSLDEGQKLLDLQGTHADRVAIVAVNLDACPRDRAIDRRLGDGDCVDILDDSADVDSLAIRFGVQRAPTTLVLDGGGKLVARGARGGRLLERHLLGYETKPAQLPRSESTAAATAP
jgi:thiol-disulfide isomerase/thioredoxin